VKRMDSYFVRGQPFSPSTRLVPSRSAYRVQLRYEDDSFYLLRGVEL
jgi:hypothetical protein